MSYPLVSSAINNYVSRSMVKEYTDKVAQMPSEKTQKMFEEATKYNNSLSNNMIITDPFDEKAFQKIGERYEHTLSVDEDGLIGYIDIPKINVYLPIYHGTSEEILSKGAGHLQNTSLPVGGKSTHAVISAHSGYPGETFFDYLTDMKVGDEFYVHILDRTLKYEVDQIEVVLPSEINSLRIVDGEDLVTLLTCTPYGVNTHRLLVRGKHVAYDDTKYVETGVSLAKFDNGYIFFLGYKIPYAVAAGIIVGFVALVVFVVIFLLKRKKKLILLTKILMIRAVMQMLKKILTVVAIVMLVVGIGLVAFSPISNFVGTQISNGEADSFDIRVEEVEDGSFEEAVKDGKVDKEGYKVDKDGKRTSKQPVVFKVDLDRLFKDSVAYNKKLESSQYELFRNDTYSQAAINLSNYGISDGIYGYVSAKTIGMRLPIYLGANSANMSYGAAHMSATSLPIGGNNTNTVLAGHTGYVGRIFFDNLRNLKMGDKVSITNYWDTIDYKVVETKVNKPNESEDCYIKNGKDLLTMFTCISDGNGGFDRYYVICERAS